MTNLTSSASPTVAANLSGSCSNGVALNGTTIFVADSGCHASAGNLLDTVPVAGGLLSVVQTASVRAVTVDANNIYWTDGTANTVMSRPIGGNSPTTLATNQTGTGAIAVDATSVYWVNAPQTGNQIGSVMKVAKP